MIKGLKIKNMIYPAIFFFVIILTAVMFIFSIKFFLKTIGGIFDLDQSGLESQIVRVDTDNFSRAAKKLGIEMATSSDTQIVDEIKIDDGVAGEVLVAPVPSPDKKEIKIAVYNATKEKGLASVIKKELEANDFVVDKIGNYSLEKETVLKVKKEFEVFSDEIKGIIEKKYTSSAVTEILSDEEEYGIIIIIGSQK